MKKCISFVVAVYQNEEAVTRTYEKISTLFSNELKAYDYEIVFVDDGSQDASYPELLALHERDKNVKVISFTRNFGQMAAMLAGFKHATGDAVINISADLQDPVRLIPEMISNWESGMETVVCYRTDRSDNLAARLFSHLAYGILRRAVPQIPRGGFDFVLMDRKVMDEFNSVEVRNRFFQGDLLWLGFKASFIPYVREKRTIGTSQYTFWKKFKNFADAILDASYMPIRFISFVGFFTALAGFIYMITVVMSWIFNATPFSGWAPIMMAILMIGGMIMMMLGVIGEYLWRE